MSSMLYRIGRFASRRWLPVLGVWLITLGLVTGAALAFHRDMDDTFAISGSESQESLDHLRNVFPEFSGSSAQIVLIAPAGQRVDSTRNRAAVQAVLPRVSRLDQVAAVVDPFAPGVQGTLSPDRRALLIAVPLTVDRGHTTDATREALTSIGTDLQKAAGPGSTVHVGGDVYFNQVPGLGTSELLGLIAALLVLLLAFRSVIAATVPVVSALIGVGIAAASIYACTALTPISSPTPMVAIMLGLAVGIDYSLFILSRHRDQLREGIPVVESVARATATAGSAVMFAGLTVIIALLGLAVVGIAFVTTMGIAAAGAVTLAVLIAITLTPALLGMVGDRLRPGRTTRAGRWNPFRRLRFTAPSPARGWVRLVTGRPVITILVVTLGLGALAVPATDLRLSVPDNGTEPVGTAARQTYDAISEYFGPGYNAPLLVTVDVLASTDPVGVTNRIAAEIRRLPDVAEVPLATPNRSGDIAVIEVIPPAGQESPRTEALVQRLRAQKQHFLDRYGVGIAVTGITAITIDVSDRLSGAMLPFGAVVVGLSLVLLTMVFRSIAVPIKAAVGYLLSIGAAFGLTSLVFQHGTAADALRVTHIGSVICSLPITLMGILFGLAMDYEVFVVSRIREAYVHGAEPRQAIETGFRSASRVVVSAAVIMFAVFAAFVPDGTSLIKPMAFSLAAGVLVDAFLVRMTLVPALLALLGHRAWWLPSWLDRRLPRFDIEGADLAHQRFLATWHAAGPPEAIRARGVGTCDDRGVPRFAGVDLHVPPGDVQVIRGPAGAGKTALLYTLAGRVGRLQGDLVVLGRPLPYQAHALRRQVAVISCAVSPDVAAEVTRARAEGVRLVLLDDVDLVARPAARAALRTAFATAPGDEPVTVVLTGQHAMDVAELLPGRRVHVLDLGTEARPDPDPDPDQIELTARPTEVLA